MITSIWILKWGGCKAKVFLAHPFLSLIPAVRARFELDRYFTPPKPTCTDYKEHLQPRKESTSISSMGTPTAWPSYHQEQPGILLSTSAVEIASAGCAPLMWLPGKAERQGTALPPHFQRSAVAHPSSVCWSTVCLPFMPMVEQLDTFTHNMSFRASHPYLQLHTTYTTGLMPGTYHSTAAAHIWTRSTLACHFTAHSYNAKLAWQVASPASVPGTQPLPTPTRCPALPASHVTRAHKIDDIIQVQSRLFLTQPPTHWSKL